MVKKKTKNTLLIIIVVIVAFYLMGKGQNLQSIIELDYNTYGQCFADEEYQRNDGKTIYMPCQYVTSDLWECAERAAGTDFNDLIVGKYMFMWGGNLAISDAAIRDCYDYTMDGGGIRAIKNNIDITDVSLTADGQSIYLNFRFKAPSAGSFLVEGEITQGSPTQSILQSVQPVFENRCDIVRGQPQNWQYRNEIVVYQNAELWQDVQIKWNPELSGRYYTYLYIITDCNAFEVLLPQQLIGDIDFQKTNFDPWCEESVYVKDVFNGGLIEYDLGDGTTHTDIDSCASSTSINEVYCNGDSPASVVMSCPSGYVCEAPQPGWAPVCVEGQSTQCTDSDSDDLQTKGTVTYNGMTYTDSCYNSQTISEYICVNNEMVMFQADCMASYGTSCSNGACGVETRTCSETDGGKNYDTPGITTVCVGNDCEEYNDFCLDNNFLAEYYCDTDNTAALDDGHYCSNGCGSGACGVVPLQYYYYCTDGTITQSLNDVVSTFTTCGSGYVCKAQDRYPVSGTIESPMSTTAAKNMLCEEQGICGPADTNNDGTISRLEVLNYANKWVNNQGATRIQVLEVANKWVNGQC